MTWTQDGKRFRYADATGKVIGIVNQETHEFAAWLGNTHHLGLYVTLAQAKTAVETAAA